jgi:hypothetical protein
MNSELQSDLLRFKVWYNEQIALHNKLIEGEENSPERKESILEELKVKKLEFMDKAARKVVDIYIQHGYYPYL